MNNGSCLCGDIKWTTDGDFTMLVNCHCSICRKVHGSAYGSFVASSVDGFKWVRGEEKVQVYDSSENGQRPFCPRCGSSVAALAGKLAVMPAGNLDGEIKRSVDSNIFVAHKACWFDITDGGPEFDEFSIDYTGVPVESEERLPVSETAVGGSCSCGQVRYEFEGPADRMDHCHCESCRKSRSAPFSTQTFVAPDRFRWLLGEDNIVHFNDPESTHYDVAFCRICSTPLPVHDESADMILIPAGSIDQDPGIRPQAHLNAESKAPWVEINDDLPQR